MTLIAKKTASRLGILGRIFKMVCNIRRISNSGMSMVHIMIDPFIRSEHLIIPVITSKNYLIKRFLNNYQVF